MVLYSITVSVGIVIFKNIFPSAAFILLNIEFVLGYKVGLAL